MVRELIAAESLPGETISTPRTSPEGGLEQEVHHPEMVNKEWEGHDRNRDDRPDGRFWSLKRKYESDQ